MFSNLRRKLKDDRGSSELIAIILGFPLILFTMFSVIDISAYFVNLSSVKSVAQDGARTVAIVGGMGTATMATPLEARYGLTADACDSIVKGSSLYKATSTPVECQVMKNMMATKLINTEVTEVTCTPMITKAVGDSTSCTVKWTYGGVPLSFFMLDRVARGSDSFYVNTSIGTSEAEVGLSGVALVPRS